MEKIKQHFKNGYILYKREFDELKNIPQEERCKIYYINKKVYKSQLFIFAGLYNKNKELYDKGLNDYMEVSTKQLDNPAPFQQTKLNLETLEEFDDDIYDKEEAVRQLANHIKLEYDEYKKFGKLVFG